MPSLMGRFIGKEIEEEIPDEILEENEGELGGLTPDPVPAPRSSGFSMVAPIVAGKVTPAMKKRIAAELEAYIDMAAIPLVMRDPTCGGAIADQAKPLAAAIAQILARHPELAHKFMASGVLGDWLQLAMAITPIVKTVWSHHISSAPQESTDDGTDLPDGFDPFRAGS